MDRVAFHELLKRFIDGTCTAEETALINQWYDLLDGQDELSKDESNIEELENRMWNTIKDQLREKDVPSGSIPFIHALRKYFTRVAIGAVLIAVIIIAHFFITNNNASLPNGPVLKNQPNLVEETNLTGSKKIIQLQDGSNVILAPQARLSYTQPFARNKREVYLQGEAFFEVSKDSARPFLVYNGLLVTEVLGTSFKVNLVDNKTVVTVRTVRVAVYENGEKLKLNEEEKKNNGVIITPNQKVTYYPENRHFITSVADAPVVVQMENTIPHPDSFTFNDTPLAIVLHTLEKSYAIDILLSNNQLGDCPFTGDLTDQSLFNQLEFICQAFHAQYEIKGTSILITGGDNCR